MQSFSRLNTQQFTDTLAKAIVRASQNTMATTPLCSISIQPQQQITVRLEAKIKLRARLIDGTGTAEVNDVVDDDIDAEDDRSASNVEDNINDYRVGFNYEAEDDGDGDYDSHADDESQADGVGKPGDPYIRRNPLPDIPILTRTYAAPAG